MQTAVTVDDSSSGLQKGVNVSASILVLDDDENITRLTRSVLSMSGYEVAEHNHPVEALEVVKGKAFDLILTDIMMPEMNGVEFIRKARTTEHNAATRYAVLSAKKLKQEDRREIFDLGAEIMVKPFMPNQLVDMIAQLLAKEPRPVAPTAQPTPQEPSRPTVGTPPTSGPVAERLLEQVSNLDTLDGKDKGQDKQRLHTVLSKIVGLLAALTPEDLEANLYQVRAALVAHNLQASAALRSSFVHTVRSLGASSRNTILKAMANYRQDPHRTIRYFTRKAHSGEAARRRAYIHYAVYAILGATLKGA